MSLVLMACTRSAGIFSLCTDTQHAAGSSPQKMSETSLLLRKIAGVGDMGCCPITPASLHEFVVYSCDLSATACLAAGLRCRIAFETATAFIAAGLCCGIARCFPLSSYQSRQNTCCVRLRLIFIRPDTAVWLAVSLKRLVTLVTTKGHKG